MKTCKLILLICCLTATSFAQKVHTSEMAGFTVSMPEGWQLQVLDSIPGAPGRSEMVTFQNATGSNVRFMTQDIGDTPVPDDKKEVFDEIYGVMVSGLKAYNIELDYDVTKEIVSGKEFYKYTGTMSQNGTDLGMSISYYYINDGVLFAAAISYAFINEEAKEPMMEAFKKAAATL